MSNLEKSFSATAEMPGVGIESTVKWETAAVALKRVEAVMGYHAAVKAICSRANDGLLIGRAKQLLSDSESYLDIEIPGQFWWARGASALTKNWVSGDFETWVDQKYFVRAFGVVFRRDQIDEIVGTTRDSNGPEGGHGQVSVGQGRPRQPWWEDLLIEIARQLYVGDLQPKRQSEIESAMLDWMAKNSLSASDSTVRMRAKKVWEAIRKEAEK